MDFSKFKISALLEELDPRALYKQIKSTLEDVFVQLRLDNAAMLKPEHQEQFRRLRTEYIALMDKARNFCDTAEPPVQYAIDLLRKKSEIDFDTLLEMSEKINPGDVLKDCDQLYRNIGALNDAIRSDPEYERGQYDAFTNALVGGVCCIGSIALVFAVTWAAPLEAALLVGGALTFGATLPSAVHFCKGLSADKLEHDVRDLSEKLTEADKNILEMKTKLSDIKRTRGRIEIQLHKHDAESLLVFYERIDKNLEDIRNVCLRPLD